MTGRFDVTETTLAGGAMLLQLRLGAGAVVIHDVPAVSISASSYPTSLS